MIPIEKLREVVKVCEMATPGPHQTRFIYRLIRAVRIHQTTLGLMMHPDDTRDWADAEMWSTSADPVCGLKAMAEELIALKEAIAAMNHEEHCASLRWTCSACGTGSVDHHVYGAGPLCNFVNNGERCNCIKSRLIGRQQV